MTPCPALRYLLACDAVARIAPWHEPWMVREVLLERDIALMLLRAELALCAAGGAN